MKIGQTVRVEVYEPDENFVPKPQVRQEPRPEREPAPAEKEKVAV